MILSLIVITVIILAVGMFLTINNVDIKKIYNNYKRLKQRTKREQESFSLNLSINGKLAKVERLIQQSNIRVYINYSVWMHLTLCAIFFILGFVWLRQYMNLVISGVFGLGLSIIPFVILKIISDFISYKIKRISVDFLIIIKNFFIINKSGDMFEAFKKSCQYIPQPMKMHTELMVYEYENKINPLQCLDNFKNRIEVAELKLFIDNLKISYIHGGDIVALIDAFIVEIGEQNDDEDDEATEDAMLNAGLYVLLAINMAVMYLIVTTNLRVAILEPLWGQAVFTLDILFSIYIVYQSLEKLET